MGDLNIIIKAIMGDKADWKFVATITKLNDTDKILSKRKALLDKAQRNGLKI